MYEPPLHRQEDLEQVFALMAAHPLGLLISHGAGGLLANPIPFTRADDGSRFGLLRAHLARANPQWRELSGEALVVFQGAGHYITPSWYATKRETGKVVPTWNYVMVAGARGRARRRGRGLAAGAGRAVDGRARGRAGRALEGRGRAGGLSSRASCARSSGSRSPCRDLRGKWKASQNRPQADREGVVAGLGDDPMAGVVREAATRPD